MFNALKRNIDYRSQSVFGIPGTFLDEEIFHPDAPFLKDAPFLSTLIANPNHIGVHTLDNSESHFSGTQELEREVIKICAESLFSAQPDSVDGYVASGGTEANLQAMWVYRNYFVEHHHADLSEIGVLFSQDSHYSMTKGCNLLGIEGYALPVDEWTRQITVDHLRDQLIQWKDEGKKYIILILNMGTTMFGSVDDPQPLFKELEAFHFVFKVHIDAAFGGFIFPVTYEKNVLDFRDDRICSITLDAHKMLQAPYGTGIFLVRKGYLHYVCAESASYVQGKDHTLCGSRSGANAVAVWMVLHTYGRNGWEKKMENLMKRTDRLCEALRKHNIPYFRQHGMNLITMPSKNVPEEIAGKYFLVADQWNEKKKWWKIVVMEHITEEMISNFEHDLEKSTLGT